MTAATTEPKPVLLRALKKRWMNYYMLGPGEAAGDLFWWDGKGHRPRDTEEVDHKAAGIKLPRAPKAQRVDAPGAGPKARSPFAPAESDQT